MRSTRYVLLTRNKRNKKRVTRHCHTPTLLLKSRRNWCAQSYVKSMNTGKQVNRLLPFKRPKFLIRGFNPIWCPSLLCKPCPPPILLSQTPLRNSVFFSLLASLAASHEVNCRWEEKKGEQGTIARMFPTVRAEAVRLFPCVLKSVVRGKFCAIKGLKLK